MKRWLRKYGIALSVLLLLLFAGVTGSALAGGSKATPTPEPTPTPQVFEQITASWESGHADKHVDAFGNTILLDGADCATGVIRFTVGSGRTKEVTTQEIKQILGWPDYDAENRTGTLNLGRGGEIILDMNVFIRDSAGMFLYIFTTGKPEDKMSVSLSADMIKWYEIEVKSKNFTGLDKYTNIPATVKPRYVKIKDRSESGDGVCIDAVVTFDAEPIVKPEKTEAEKKPWYAKFGLTKKSATALCVGIGSILLIIFILRTIRWYNIRKRRRKLRLVYSRKRDGARRQEGNK